MINYFDLILTLLKLLDILLRQDIPNIPNIPIYRRGVNKVNTGETPMPVKSRITDNKPEQDSRG